MRPTRRNRLISPYRPSTSTLHRNSPHSITSRDSTLSTRIVNASTGTSSVSTRIATRAMSFSRRYDVPHFEPLEIEPDDEELPLPVGVDEVPRRQVPSLERGGDQQLRLAGPAIEDIQLGLRAGGVAQGAAAVR